MLEGNKDGHLKPLFVCPVPLGVAPTDHGGQGRGNVWAAIPSGETVVAATPARDGKSPAASAHQGGRCTGHTTTILPDQQSRHPTWRPLLFGYPHANRCSSVSSVGGKLQSHPLFLEHKRWPLVCISLLFCPRHCLTLAMVSTPDVWERAPVGFLFFLLLSNNGTSPFYSHPQNEGERDV